ncbi:MAG: peptide chain release factor N(5)-glutamine methyltransferase [Alteraurantiacibacter sp.]
MADTVASAIRNAAARLGNTSDTARLDAELLMAHALDVSRSDMLLRHMQDDAPQQFAQLMDRRSSCEPVAYILGRQEFFGLDFLVGDGVLIPRGDSECVVEAALDAAPHAKRLLDLGTGSGALLLALLSHLPNALGVGIDRAPSPMKIAGANADLHDLAMRANFLERDWTKRGWADGLGDFDLIICNPPYVESDADLTADVRDFEPAGALFAGPEGLDDYRILIPQLPDLLAQNGVAVLEIGHLQGAAVAQIAADHGSATNLYQDLGGRDRALVLRFMLGKGESSG